MIDSNASLTEHHCRSRQRSASLIFLKVWVVVAGAIFLLVPDPAECAAACKFVKIQALQVSFDGFRPTIDGSIDEKPIKILLDSGAQFSGLTDEAAKRLDLISHKSSATSFGMGGESGL